MIGGMFILYVIFVAMIKPKLAPPYLPEKVKITEKIRSSVHLVPLMVIFFLVVGLIYFGIATASESAALGVGGAYILASLSGGLNRSIIKKSFVGAATVVGMIFFIIMGSRAFCQVLAYTGVTSQLAQTIVNLPISRWWILIGMQVVVFFLGCLMDPISIMYITIPIYIPIVKLLHFDSLWFSIIMMINLELACITPPFGLHLFVAKGIAPKEVSMMDIYISVFPFCLMHLAGMVVVMLFPGFFLFFPNMMTR